MLALGRAMMAKPRLLLLDEPSLGLAPLVVREIFDALRQLNETGTTIVVVEQNAALALARRAARVRARDGAHRARRRRREARRAGRRHESGSRASYLGVLMANFLQQVVSGLASGGIYGSARARDRAHPPRDRRPQLRAGRAGDALGVHLLDARSTTAGRSGLRSARRSLLSFGGRRRDRADADPADPERPAGRRSCILTIGLLLAVNGLDDLDLGRRAEAVRRAVLDRADHVGGVAFSKQDLGVIGVSLVAVVLVGLLFARTKLGLGLRATAVEPDRGAARRRARRRDARASAGASPPRSAPSRACSPHRRSSSSRT